MNTKMYQHPLTQKNIEILKKIDYNMIQPKKSLLACGDFGEGALADLPDILSDLKILYKINEVFMKNQKRLMWQSCPFYCNYGRCPTFESNYL